MSTIHQVIERSCVFTQAQFDRFAALSGDDNPIHVDPAFAARTKFGRTVAHGMFLYANIAREIGALLPGALPLEQELMFPAPTYTDEEVWLHVQADEPPAAGLARLATHVVKPDGSFGCQGSALLQLPGGTPPIAAPLPRVTARPDWKGLRVGQEAVMERTYTRADLAEYIDLLAERNPLYTAPAVAADLGLPAAPLPGPLLGALFSCILGTRLPGRGTNWLKHRFVFHAPTYPDQLLTARAQIVRLRPAKELVNLRTWITTADGQLVCDGEALVWVSDVE